MPLIKCPDCGASVSDTAATCPKCGYDKTRDNRIECPSCKSRDVEKTSIYSQALKKTFCKCKSCGHSFHA